MAQITYATVFVWAVFGPNDGKKKERKKEHISTLLDLLGFAASKKGAHAWLPALSTKKSTTVLVTTHSCRIAAMSIGLEEYY